MLRSDHLAVLESQGIIGCVKNRTAWAAQEPQTAVAPGRRCGQDEAHLVKVIKQV